MSRNLPIRVTISLVFRYIVWQFIALIINYKEIVLDKLWLPSLIVIAAERWGEKFVLRGRLTVENKERGGMGRWRFSPFPRPLPTPSTLTPNQTNDPELVTLARIDKTPALQANKASPLRECEKKVWIVKTITVLYFNRSDYIILKRLKGASCNYL